jgi:hypothetical protein
MLKRTAIKLFKEAENITGVQDKPALGQAWSMYIDSLHRDGYITDRQVQNWSNPFYN